MKWFELFAWLLAFGFAAAVAFYLASYVDAAAHSAIGRVALGVGMGANLTPSTNVYASRGGLWAAAGDGTLWVEGGVCVHVSNATWWDVVCGPATLKLKGVYTVAVWHADTSLQKEFAKNLSTVLFWALVAIFLVAWILYEYYR